MAKMKAGRKCWGKCVACGERQTLDRRDLDKAAGPRCVACGCRVQVSEAQAERTAAARDGREPDGDGR